MLYLPIQKLPEKSDYDKFFGTNGVEKDTTLSGSSYAEDIADWLGIGAARRQREFEAEEAQKNRDWQTDLSKNAITNQVQDMLNAGINPILSANYGGAVVPNGSTAHGTRDDNNGLNSLIKLITILLYKSEEKKKK